MILLPPKVKFRARDYARLGRNCTEFQEVLRLLPPESTLHGWFRDSRAGRHQHRFKFGDNIANVDFLSESAEIPIAPCRLLRFYNDSKGSELLGPGAFVGFCLVKNRWDIPPGDTYAGFAAALRRPAENLRGLRIRRRPINADRLGMIESILFESVWGARELRQQFLKMLELFEAPEDVDESTRVMLATGAFSIADARLDEIDRDVFGALTPHLPSIFEMIVNFWQEYGVEWLVAREALCEFLPE